MKVPTNYPQLRDCCNPDENDLVAYQHRKFVWEDSFFLCRHCGQIWREETYHGSCSGEIDYRLIKVPARFAPRRKVTPK